MKCPKCKTELVVSGQARLETLDEHVMCVEPSMKDVYICPNTNCVCNSKVKWNEEGDCYGGYDLFTTNEIDSPYSSLSRQLDIEIYKKGLKKRTMLPAWLLFWFLRPLIEYEYKGDRDGNILSKSYKLSIHSSETPWKPFKTNEEFSIRASWWIHTWRYLWKKYKREGFSKSYNRDFPYRAFEWFVHNFKLTTK